MRFTLETGETLEAEAVILATPAYVTAQLVGDLDSYMAAALRGIGIPDCIASGETAATAALKYLQSLSEEGPA